MMTAIASNIIASLPPEGAAEGKYSCKPSLWARISAPGITSPSATTKLANLVARASRTPEFARPCWWRSSRQILLIKDAAIDI